MNDKMTPAVGLTDPVTRVRANGRETSWEAATAQVEGKVGEQQVLIYGLLKAAGERGLTDDELRQVMTRAFVKHSRSGVSVRRMELERAGWVRVAVAPFADGVRPVKRASDAGSPMLVWVAVAPGEGEPATGAKLAGMSRVQRARQDAAADALEHAAEIITDDEAIIDALERLASGYRTGARKA